MVVMFSVAVVPTRFMKSQSYFNSGRRAAQLILSHSNCCFSDVTILQVGNMVKEYVNLCPWQITEQRCQTLRSDVQ